MSTVTLSESLTSHADLLLQLDLGSREAIRLFRAALLRQALVRANGNQCRAAELLKVHRNTLARMITEFSVDPRTYKRKPTSETRNRSVAA